MVSVSRAMKFPRQRLDEAQWRRGIVAWNLKQGSRRRWWMRFRSLLGSCEQFFQKDGDEFAVLDEVTAP